MQRGQFAPPGETPPHDYAALQKLVADARDGLLRLTPNEVNALEGGEVVFQIRDFKMPFTAEGFLMSFSLPNFYFHATTAYDILRSKAAYQVRLDQYFVTQAARPPIAMAPAKLTVKWGFVVQRPMHMSRLRRFSCDFHSRWRSPSRSMSLPGTREQRHPGP
jgi:Domain of unknown function (DUF1993)